MIDAEADDGAARSPYRPQALERLESPEGLDDVASVTDSKAWMAVLAVAVAIAVLAAWGVFGRVPQVVTVPGVLVRAGAESVARAKSPGSVRELQIRVGDRLDVGDVVLTVATRDGDVEVVEASSGGTVQEVTVAVGESVDAGTVVARILDTRSEAPLEAVAYVDGITASQLGGATDVTVQPASVDPTEYGSLEGTVGFVSTLPASVDSMATTLQSEALADSLLRAAGGVAYLVVVEFDDPPRWTNDDPPPFLLADSTLADVSGVVTSKRPISLLFGG